MNTAEKSGIVVIVLGVIYSVLSYNIDRATIGNPTEPMIFPLILGIVLTLCGIALFFTEYRKKAAKAVGEAEAKPKFTFDFEKKMIVFICVISIVYGLIFEKLGYVLSTTIFLLGLLMAFSGWKKWLLNLVIAFGFSVAIYYCFSTVLGIPLPKVPLLNI